MRIIENTTKKRTQKVALNKLTIFISFFASVFVHPSMANHHIPDKVNIEKLIQQAEEQSLANHIGWKRLLHYPDGENVSRALGKADFFVSSQGGISTQAEMRAMLSAIMTDANQGNGSVQCRFPARTHWLKQQLNLSLPVAHCAKYNAWQHQLQPHQLVVMFAQEYPDSMTSAFAHTLLRIDTDANPEQNNYQGSYAINYTVDGDASDAQAVYAIKSMTGKYEGVMTVDPYVPKLNNYLKTDQRDVWTYQLKLSQAEREQMMRHVWEVKDLGLPYYFLTDNCASEILRLVDVVRPESQLYSQVNYMAIPSEVVRLLDSNDLLRQGDYHPAEKSLQQSRFNLNNFNVQRHFVADVANNNPVNAMNLQRASIALGQMGDHHDYVELGLRASYHDLLDSTVGYRQHHDLEGINLKLRVYDDSGNTDNLQLQELTLLRGRSFHPINTARRGTSWGLHAGLKQVMDGSADYINDESRADDTYSLSQQHLVGSIGYEKGVSIALGNADSQYELPPHLCYAFGQGTGQIGQGLTNGFRIGIEGNLGCTYRMNDKLRAMAEVSLPYWYHGPTDLEGHKSGYLQPIASLGLQYDMIHNHALRINADYDLSDRVADDVDIKVGWNWYF